MAEIALSICVEVGRAVLALRLLQPGGQEARPLGGVEGAHLVGRAQVLAHRRVEGEEVLDRGLGVVGEVLDDTGVAVDHPGAELVARGVGDHPGVGLVADAQAVLGEQVGGVGVVGRDGRLEDVLLVVAGRGVEDPGRDEGGPDAGAQLAGGLGGEGEAEDLVGAHLAR